MISDKQREKTRQVMTRLAEGFRGRMERATEDLPKLPGPGCTVEWRRYKEFLSGNVDIFEGDAIENNRAVEYWEGVRDKALSPDTPEDVRNLNLSVAERKLKEERAINRMMAL